jgi:hypothetical protein
MRNSPGFHAAGRSGHPILERRFSFQGFQEGREIAVFPALEMNLDSGARVLDPAGISELPAGTRKA